MTSKWYEVHPADRATAAIMRFTLAHCQGIKTYAVERISNGDRKPGGPAGSKNKGIEAWLREYIARTPATADIPRYALRDALTGVWEDGIHKQMPYQKKEWNLFRVDPRPGWRGNKRSNPYTVDLTKHTKALFEEGKLDFRWGHLLFKRKALGELRLLLVEKDWLQEELLPNIERFEFFCGDKKTWLVNFVWRSER